MLDEKVDVGDTDEQGTEIDLAAPAPELAATILPDESTVMFDAVKLPTAGLIILGINYLSSLKLINHLYI